MRRCEHCGAWSDAAVKALSRKIAAYERARRTTNRDDLARERRQFDVASAELAAELAELDGEMRRLVPDERAPEPALDEADFSSLGAEWQPPRVEPAPPPDEFHDLVSALAATVDGAEVERRMPPQRKSR